MGLRYSVGWIAIVACLLGGCGPVHPLDEVPIVGGSDAERALVRDLLVRFDEWTGGDRVQLREVVIETHEDGVAGTYRKGAKRITLRPGLGSSYLSETVRHELCHALDHQEGYPSEDQGFEALHDAYLALGEVSHETDASSVRRRATEGFALFCEQGPWENALATEPCDGVPGEARQQAAWVRDEVWRGVYTGPSLRRELVGSIEADIDTLVTVVVDDDGTTIYGQGPDGPVFLTGPDYGTVPDTAAYMVAEPPSPPAVFDVVGRVGSSAVALTSVGPGHAQVLLGTLDGGDWGPVEAGCWDRSERLFEIGEGQIGAAWLDEGQVHFARLAPVSDP